MAMWANATQVHTWRNHINQVLPESLAFRSLLLCTMEVHYIHTVNYVHSHSKPQAVSMTVVLEHSPLNDQLDAGSVVFPVDICLDGLVKIASRQE